MQQTYFLLDTSIEIIDVLPALVGLIKFIADACPLSGISKVVVKFVKRRALVNRVILGASVILIPHKVLIYDSLYQGRIDKPRNFRRMFSSLTSVVINGLKVT